MVYMAKSDNRIWELDALRGLMILIMVFIHLCFDLDYFRGIDLVKNPALQFCMDHCGVSFVILSGLCAVLGRRSVRRGLQVLGGGLIITAVTGGMYLLGMADQFIVIWFGVLHLLGTCMLLWPLFRRLPTWVLAVLGAVLVALGAWAETAAFGSWWLMPLGLIPPGFSSSDYFPLLPYLGWFLLGACLGRLLYGRRQSLLPDFPSGAWPVRALRWCGTHSLWIYLLHQPVLYALVQLL